VLKGRESGLILFIDFKAELEALICPSKTADNFQNVVKILAAVIRGLNAFQELSGKLHASDNTSCNTEDAERIHRFGDIYENFEAAPHMERTTGGAVRSRGLALERPGEW
jgi:hypothetical protein